jgi:hypothetical protein
MENLGFVGKVTTLGILLVAIASTCGATAIPVRGGSNYGANSPDPGFFTDCVNGTVTLACEAFNSTPTAITFNGLNYNVFEFVTGNTGIAGTLYYVIDLGSVGPNSTFTLPTAFFPVAGTEIFSCNKQDDLSTNHGFLFDSGGNPFTGPCTANLATNPGLSQDGTSFKTDGNFNVFNLVLDAPVAAVSTPEPSSIILLGAGLLGVWGGRKRLLIR